MNFLYMQNQMIPSHIVHSKRVDCFYCVPKNTVEKNTVEKTQWELIHKIIKGLLAQGVLLPCLNELVRVCMMGIW